MFSHWFAHYWPGIAIVEATNRGNRWAQVYVEFRIAVDIAENTCEIAGTWENINEHIVNANELRDEHTHELDWSQKIFLNFNFLEGEKTKYGLPVKLRL